MLESVCHTYENIKSVNLSILIFNRIVTTCEFNHSSSTGQYEVFANE